MCGQQIRPDLNVLVLDLGESQIQRLLVLVSLRGRQHPIQVCGVGFVLPVMLERVEIRRG
jgi:hypothetical protein